MHVGNGISKPTTSCLKNHPKIRVKC